MKMHFQLKAENRRRRCWGGIRWPISTRSDWKSGGHPDCPAGPVSRQRGHCNCVLSPFSLNILQMMYIESQKFVNDDVAPVQGHINVQYFQDPVALWMLAAYKYQGCGAGRCRSPQQQRPCPATHPEIHRHHLCSLHHIAALTTSTVHFRNTFLYCSRWILPYTIIEIAYALLPSSPKTTLSSPDLRCSSTPIGY